jgi:hypothetical protein
MVNGAARRYLDGGFEVPSRNRANTGQVEMLKATKFLIQIGLAFVLLISFGAVAYDAGLDADGDENLGVAIVVAEAKSTADQNGTGESRVRIASSTSSSRPSYFVSKFGLHVLSTASPLSLLGSPQICVPLRP